MDIKEIAARQGFFVSDLTLTVSDLIINKPVIYAVRDGKVAVSISFNPGKRRHLHDILDATVDQGLFCVFDGELMQIELSSEVLEYLNAHYEYRPLQDLQSEVVVQETHSSTFFYPGHTGTGEMMAMYCVPNIPAEGPAPLAVLTNVFVVPLKLTSWLRNALYDNAYSGHAAAQVALFSRVHCPSRIGTLLRVVPANDVYNAEGQFIEGVTPVVTETIRVGRYILTLETNETMAYYALAGVKLAW